MSVGVDEALLDGQLLTPRVRTSFRRALFWILGIVLVLGVGFAIMLLQRAGQSPTDVLDPDAATPQGARAVVEVLRGQGVEVIRTSTLLDTIDEVASHPEVTVVLRDDAALLTDEQYRRVLELDARLVLLAPGFTQLDILAPGIEPAGALVTAETVLGAECEAPTAARAQAVSVLGLGYRIVDDPAAIGCFPGDAADAFGYLETQRGGVDIAILGPEELLRNDSITRSGNAAFALALLGVDPTVVWYEPSAEDLRDADRVPTLQELAGPWVTPLAILIVLVVVTAGVWRGRRFGPLVIERLPVEVRANETMEGRARLYARSDARAHAAQALRIGSLGRLADRVGLSRGAGLDELVPLLAAQTGRSPEALERLLGAHAPGSDAELMRISDELQHLETELAAAASPTITEKEGS